MFRSLVRLTFFTLLIAAFVGCDSGSDGEGGNGGSSNAPFTAIIEGEGEFSTDDVFVLSGFGLTMVATSQDGERTITLLISAQNMTARTYDIGAGTGFLASASLVRGEGSDDPTNNVFNASTGSGQITVQSIDADRAAGTFNFTATNGNGASVVVRSGTFDVEL